MIQPLANLPASQLPTARIFKNKAEQRYIRGIGRQETLRLYQVATKEVESRQQDRCNNSSSP